MRDQPEWGPRPLDVERANGARIYDCLLGGAHNFEVDREAVRQLFDINPEADKVAISNRQFVRRTVRFLIDQGIDQFLDLGSGVPTVGNVHEIAQTYSPRARVVYVDNEPVAYEATLELLKNEELAEVVYADLRQPRSVFRAEETRRLLDFDRPIGLLMNAALHYVPDSEDLPAIMARYREMMRPGSYLVVSHLTHADRPRSGTEVFDKSSTPVTLRTHAEVTELLAGLDLLPPGLVYVPSWRPDGAEIYVDAPHRSMCLGAVAYQPD
ncbi:MAG TPA: SAM-dependent methyltransferase [Pseudonocardiaceae bacterium]|nr:SAM-dependent methyltransferase [Pseudonocardiaceae bacterium]